MKSILIVLILGSSNLCHALELKGTAKSIKTEQAIYTEEHSIQTDAAGFYKRVESIYKDTDGQIIAKMISDFSKDLMVPEIQFEDYRFKKKESLIFENKETLKFTIEEDGKSAKNKTLKYSKDMVAGQGFDNFVKKNFEALQEKNIPLNFGVLASMNFYQFKRLCFKR